jgi:hypothetical protein
MRRLICLVALVITSCSWAIPVRAQTAADPPRARFEVLGGITSVAPRMTGSIETSFVPRVVGQAPAGAAGQTLLLDGGSAAGVEVGFNCLVSRSAGLQVLVGYDRLPLGGRNGPYSGRLDYTASQPPKYVPQSYTARWSSAWPDTSGTLRQLTLAVNAMARWAAGRRLAGSVSAGLAVFDVRGSAQSLGYTSSYFGGHAVLFGNEYKLAFALERARSMGFDVGGALEVRLAGRARIVADLRYFDGADLTPAVAVRETVNADEIYVQTVTLDDIQRDLQPPAPRLSPARVRLLIGLAIAL